MSSIGPGSFGAINLAGSLAGAQRNTGDSDRLKAAAAQRNSAADLKDVAAKSIQGIDETDETGDRDADGRTPYDFDESETPPDDRSADSGEVSPSHPRRRVGDVDGDRGVHLDLEA